MFKTMNKITKICFSCLLISLFISSCSAYDEIILYREDCLGISNDLYLHHISIVYNDGEIKTINFADDFGKYIDYRIEYKFKIDEENKSGVNNIIFNFIIARNFGIFWTKHNYDKFPLYDYKPGDYVTIYCSHYYYPGGADEVWLRFTDEPWDCWIATYLEGWSGNFFGEGYD